MLLAGRASTWFRECARLNSLSELIGSGGISAVKTLCRCGSAAFLIFVTCWPTFQGVQKVIIVHVSDTLPPETSAHFSSAIAVITFTPTHTTNWKDWNLVSRNKVKPGRSLNRTLPKIFTELGWRKCSYPCCVVTVSYPQAARNAVSAVGRRGMFALFTSQILTDEDCLVL